MKKITLILSVFILILSVQSYAQETIPLTKDTDHLGYDYERNDNNQIKRVKRKRAHKQIKQRKRANKRQMRAMRKVAKADGVVTAQERRVIKREKRKMRRSAARDFKRNKVRRTQDPGNQGRL